jgi:hypothetical protein
LAVLQTADAGALNRGDVHEHIRTAVLGLDEAIAFRGVKPLHSSCRHQAHLILKTAQKSVLGCASNSEIGGQVRAQPKSSVEKRPNRAEFDAGEYGQIGNKSNRARADACASAAMRGNR